MVAASRAHIACFVVSLLAVCGLIVPTAQAGQASAGPAYDVQATSSDGTSFVLNDGAMSITTQQIPSSGIYRRGIMEFSLASVPLGQQISSASLRLSLSSMTSNSTPSYPRLSVYGFGGDGVSQVVDATKTTTLIGQSAMITSLGTIDINLDAAYLSALRASTGYLGMVLFDPTSSQGAGFYTKEASAISAVTPLLTLTYTPEPISLASLGLGLGILAYRRRR